MDTAAITAYPRTEDSPALLIWQLSCPNNKIPKAAGTQVNGRYTESSLTTTHTDTYTASTNSVHTKPSTTLLPHVLTHATSVHDGMSMYVHAAQYDIQIALQGTIKHHLIAMERNILCDIQDAISPIVLHTCIGDPRDDPEAAFLPSGSHHSAVYTYVRNLCRPLLDQHDQDARCFLRSIVELTHAELDPRQLYTTIIQDPDMNSYHPTSRRYAQALTQLISQHQARMSIIFTTFIDTYVTSKERWLHTQLFSVSPTGHLRYHPEDRKEYPLRPRNADEVQDISPNFHTLAATTATHIQQTCQAIQPSYQQS